MKVMYKATRQLLQIKKVNIVKESACFVTEEGCANRTAKKSDWDAYFDNPKDAKAYLIEDAEGKVKRAEKSLEAAVSRLQKANNVEIED